MLFQHGGAVLWVFPCGGVKALFDHGLLPEIHLRLQRRASIIAAPALPPVE